MMREIAIKRVKDNWIDEFSNLLDKVENKEFKKALSFYKENYFEGVSRFLVEPKTTGYEDLFTNNGFTDIYVDTYRNIGTSFANWYAKSIGSLLKKQDVSGYNDIWEAAFAEEGRRIAGNRVTLVSGTAKATLKKELKRFMQDPEFMAMDERRQSRILRTRFNQYSNSQAKRLIRTEATNAANQGTMRSALDIYGKNELQKEWIAARDERVRSNHAAANGQIVDFEDKFLVGGEYLDRAGDPRGSAANVINCRCAIAPFPKQSDQLVDVLPTIAPVAATVAQEVVTQPTKLDDIIKSNPNIPKNVKDLDIEDEIDLDIFTHFKKPQTLVFKNVRAYHSMGRVVMPKTGKKKLKAMVYAHETGHYVAYSRKWIERGFSARQHKYAKELKDTFDKWYKFSMSNREKLYTELEELRFEGRKLIKKLGYPDTKEGQFLYMDDYANIRDTFGALTRERIGGGHGKSYYKDFSWQMHEFIAHSYENRFVGNKLFKYAFPDLYDDMIRMVNELDKNY